MQREKVWYEEINTVRGFAIIILLLYHAGFLRDEFLGSLEYWNLFAVPIFFFISGLVLTLRYKEELHLKPFYKKRFQYLVPAYFFWSILTTPLVRGLNFQSFVDILTGDSPGIWFLFVLFQLYLIFPILLRICRKTYEKWLFGVVVVSVAISIILLYTPSFSSLFNRFYFNFIIFENEFITVNIAKFFWFIPFSIYFILGILIGYNYERFKEKLGEYKYIIATTWISVLILVPIIIHIIVPIIIAYYPLTYTGYWNLEGICFSIASIFFFFMIFTQRSSKFFRINGDIAIAIFLMSPLILTLTTYSFFYFSAGWWLFDVASYLGVLFFALTSILFFVLAYKLWGSKFFYFRKKIAVAFFLVPTVVFTIVICFLPRPLSSTFDFFILSICAFFIAYLICLSLIALIKKIPHYQYLITEIRD